MRVDTHLHAYADAADGMHDLTAYPIVEYGEKDDVVFAGVAGTVEDALRALDEAHVDYAAMLGSYELPKLPRPADEARHWPTVPAFPEQVDGLVGYNRWLCDVGAAHPRLLPFVTANPAVMTSAQSGSHLAEAFGDWGARGLKLHPIAIRTHPDDPGLVGVYEACADARAPIVFHSGPDARGYGWSEPAGFAAVADEHPRLMLILAHLGGASWRTVTALAEAQPGIFFDLSEIVMWIGATKGPDAEQVVSLIRAIGVERITMGSDFPWYSPGATATVVESLPGLGRAERDAILGENAARILRLS